MQFQLIYFKSWKMMLWKCCTQYVSKFGKLSSGHRTGEGHFSFQSQRKAIPKLPHNCTHLTRYLSNAQNSPSQASAICEPRISRCTSRVSKRQRNQRSNWQHLLDHGESKAVPEKTSTPAPLTMLKPLCGSQKTLENSKRWEYQTTLPASWETCMQDKKQQLELDMEWWTGSKLGKKYVKAVYCHPAYLTYMQSTSCKMLGWMNHKL